MGNASEGKTLNANSNMFTSSTRKRSVFTTLLVSLATFNVRGLGSQQDDTVHSKREQLGIDCLRYTVDICAIQETKIVEPGVCTLSNGYKLIWFEQKDGRHGGLGFVISPVCSTMLFVGLLSVTGSAIWT